ncbi:putative GMC-type oxidoreductase [Sphaerisporangium krabiense]|uniref:Choline dehydrogenase n=1 Tax=Sphaerisporangium krabiense TaxID=763782 RepID=A0A7W8Z9M5_9ACTN|nr:GMC family oxidoreductase N-terminal domain-containing protein [Sphaerisporangium krabiense]MBB5630042.1 choline dehydrogenase [Sphaerisporangium krabiense]GII64989.1 putative GMC-type oxidoreductase [Sphaerisporangium krabiense]
MQYDYVIVGAGAAGCVLANRLSADPAVRVLLLEAGGADRRMEIRVPAAFSKLFKTRYDWNVTTAKQVEMSGRELYWPLGRTLGGSTSINAQMWVRGHRADYDGWNLPGWSYEEVLPYFRRSERRIGSNRGGVYGTGGPMFVSELRAPNEVTLAFLRACEEAGMTRLEELNGPSNEGFSQTPVTQERGRRWSAADGYLRPAMSRPNLTVLTAAPARRVLLDGSGRATGVEYGEGRRVTAAREVIVSAGAVGSPRLLMLSGIGDPAELRAAGVEPRHELPGVGRNLMDHLAAGIVVACPAPVTLASAESLGNLARYLFGRGGPLTSNVAEAVAFLRTTPQEPAPDIELIFAPAPFVDHGLSRPPGHGVTVGAILLQPESRGRVTLDGEGGVVVDPCYLTAEADVRRLAAGLARAREITETEALRPYAGGPMRPYGGERTQPELARYARETAETLYHPAGTCKMGIDDDAVVDPSLRVIGVPGLRVADASVMPTLNRGHTQAPTIMIAEKAADMIRAS